MANLSASHSRLALSVREKAARAIANDPGSRAYSGSNYGGGIFGSVNVHDIAYDKLYAASLRSAQFAAVKAIATTCANQEIRVGVQKGKPRGKKDKDKELRDRAAMLFAPKDIHKKSISENIEILNVHSIIDVIENPNDMVAGLKYWLVWCTVFSLNVTGLCYWYVRRDSNREAGYSIYYLPPTWVHPLKDERGKQVGWEIKPPGAESGAPVLFSHDDHKIVPFMIPNPGHPSRELSILQTQASAVNIDEQIQTAQYSTMQRGINPGIVMQVGKLKDSEGNEILPVLTEDQRRQLFESTAAAQSGAMNYGAPFIIDGMIEKVFPFTHKPGEMGFLEGAKAMCERICLAYGVSPIVLGYTEDANRASSFVAHEGFYRNIVNPTLNVMGQTITKWLGPWFSQGKRLYVWFDEAQPRDADLQLRQVDTAARHGSITKNELRESMGLPPIDGGDELIEPKADAAAGVGRPPST